MCVMLSNLFETSPFSMASRLFLYEQFRVTFQAGEGSGKHIDWFCFTSAFIPSVFGNCFVGFGWKVLPASIYFMGVKRIADKCMSELVNVHEITRSMLRYEWPRQILSIVAGKGRLGTSLSMLKRKLKAQLPVSFKNGSIAMLKRETQRRYYMYISESTMNLFLVCAKIFFDQGFL